MPDSTVQRLIGIDFGTSTSVVRVKRYKDGQPIGDSHSSSGVTFGNGESDTKAVTAVRLNADGSLTCGREGLEPTPDSTVYQEFKMDLESPDEEKRNRARELTEAYFQYLYQWYDHQHSDLGEADDAETTIVSFPVKWREETRQFMANAATGAGFKNVTAMDEASAALYATLCRKMNDINDKGILRIGEPGYLLLVDMGAGTTDLAVCRYSVNNTGGVIRPEQIKNEIVATWPIDASAPTFGGREVDRVLEDFLTRYIQDCGQDANMARQLVTGNSAVKPWKENAVSRTLNQGKRVESCAFLNVFMAVLPNMKPFPAFGRNEFEAMLADKLEQFKALVASCLNHAAAQEPELLAKGLDLVILTGGHSSWYFAEEILNGVIPGLALPQLERVQKEARVMRLSNPQETVALGLVYSRLPLKVEDKKKEAEEALKRAREEAERKAAEESRQSSGGSQSANGNAMLGAAKKFLVEWPSRHELSGWEILGAFSGILRWNSNGGRDSVSVTADEDGIRTHYIESKSVAYGHISWDCFLSGIIISTGTKLRVSSAKEETTLVVHKDLRLMNHLTAFFTELQNILRVTTPAAPGVKQSGITYVWDDRLISKAKAFIEENRKPWPELFKDPGKMALFTQTLRIPHKEELFLICANSTNFKMNYGKDGWAFGEGGIYNRNSLLDPELISWEEFLNGSISRGKGIGNYKLTLTPTRYLAIIIGPGTDAVRDEVVDLIIRLQAYLQKESLLLHPQKQ